MANQDLLLRILLVSDVHLAVDHIRTVSNEIESSSNPIDVVLLAGDMCNLKGPEYTDPESVRCAVEKIGEMVKELTKISNKVFWIPGNHDPLSTFDVESEDSIRIGGTNIHKRVVPLTHGLVLAGFGGSVPAFFDESRGNEQVWSGYPFETEEEFAREFGPFVRESLLKQEQQILLMTHVGPSASGTVNVRRLYREEDDRAEDSKPYFVIQSGSSTIQSHVDSDELQERVVLNVHGHTHDCKGSSMLGNIPVLNAGSLREGNWAVITLKQDQQSTQNSWSVRSVQHHHFSARQ